MEEEGKIKQGTIAEYIRRRTQLVGFEFGYLIINLILKNYMRRFIFLLF